VPSHKNRIKYKYAPLENGAFYFPTDDGCNLVVDIFKGEYMLWQSDYLLSHDNMFAIEFERSFDAGIEPMPYDRATCDTILQIISSKIESNGEYCVYYHHWIEDEHCSELYNSFYDELEGSVPGFEAFEYQWVDENQNSRILSVFIHNNNPDQATIIEEFTKTVGILE
jgi:hypothetical protein